MLWFLLRKQWEEGRSSCCIGRNLCGCNSFDLLQWWFLKMPESTHGIDSRSSTRNWFPGSNWFPAESAMTILNHHSVVKDMNKLSKCLKVFSFSYVLSSKIGIPCSTRCARPRWLCTYMPHYNLCCEDIPHYNLIKISQLNEVWHVIK